MPENFNINRIQNAISYSFKDPELLKMAFLHKNPSADGEGNDRLVFLGRSLLQLIFSDYIYSRYPYTPETELQKHLKNYFKKVNLSSFLVDCSIDTCIVTSEKIDSRIISDVFLALIAAIYRDGGMPSLKRFLLPMMRENDGVNSYQPKSEGNLKNNTDMIEAKSDLPKSPPPSHAPFIRDALTPISLPDSMKEPKRRIAPKKVIPAPSATDDENYKSLLQEFVQKNIRTPSVMLKYETVQLLRDLVSSSVSLDGRVLASANGDSRKTAEREAAKLAYTELSDRKSELFTWFCELSEKGIEATDTREDFVSKLNQHFQRINHESCAPVVYEKRRSSEKHTYYVVIIYNNDEVSEGYGKTLKEAKQNAAEKACEFFGI